MRWREGEVVCGGKHACEVMWGNVHMKWYVCMYVCMYVRGGGRTCVVCRVVGAHLK